MNSSILPQAATTKQQLNDNTIPLVSLPISRESSPLDMTPSILPSDLVFNFSPLEVSPTIDQSHSAKPKGASPGARHECSTAGLLPIPSPQMAIGPNLTTTTLQLLLSYYYQSQVLLPQLVKDDVFLAPAAITDNESVTTTNSNTPSDGNDWAPTPCVSPESSPSDFLCNNEPLFAGIEDLQQQQQQQHHHHHHDQIISSSPPVIVTKTESPSLNWLELTKEEDGHTSSHLNMPTPSPTASENESSLFGDDEPLSFDDLSSVNNSDLDDEYDYFASHALVLSPRPMKRKRSLVSSDEEDDSDYEGQEIEEEGVTTPVLQRLNRLRLSESKSNKTVSATAQCQRKPRAKPVSKRRAKRHPGRRARPKAVTSSASAAVAAAAIYDDLEDEKDGVHRTIFERLTHVGIDWCRYCGTTEGVNWRPGPWGKRTLCNKHGCDYKGYGIASRLPRLDLSKYSNERLEDRRRPVVQQQCVVCKSSDFSNDNMLIPCEGGCSRAYHQLCRIPAITPDAYQDQQWCCSTVCRENRKRNKVGPYEV